MPATIANPALNPFGRFGEYGFDRTDAVRSIRWAAAARLRVQGLSYKEIAQRVGYLNAQGQPVPGAARHAVMRHNEESTCHPLARPFGVEVEYIGVGFETAAAAVGGDFEGYNHVTRPGWKVVRDGSVNSGGEAVSPILQGDKGFADLRGALARLKAAGARTSTATGMHVHFDASDLTNEEIATFTSLYGANEHLIDTLVPQGRRGSRNTYCQSVRHGVTAAHVARARAGQAHARYFKVNLVSLGVHGTVEVRHHGGTLNGTKAIAWVHLMQNLIALAKATVAAGAQAPTFATMSDLLAALPAMPEESAAYVLARSNAAYATAA